MLTDDDVAGLLTLAAQLFPRDNAERVALIETACLHPEYNRQLCNVQLRLHAGTYQFLDLPALRAAMASAHECRDEKLRQANAELARKAEQLRGEKAKANASRDWEAKEFAEALRFDRPRVEELFNSYVTLNPKAPATLRGMPKTADHANSILKAWIVTEYRKQPA